MGTSQYRRPGLARRLALDHNELRRTSDRIEAWARLLLLMLFVPLAVVTTVVATGVVRDNGAGELRAAHAIRQVRAVLVAKAPRVAATAGLGTTWRARWSAGGVSHTGLVLAADGYSAGARVPVWTDRSGQLHSPPVTPGQVTSREVLASTVSPLGVGVVMWLGFLGLRRRLNIRRLAGWDRDWSVVEPQWNRQR